MTSKHPQTTSTTSAQRSMSSNPFSEPDDKAADDLMVRGATASSLAPAITGNLFGAGTTRGEAGRASSASSPPLSPLPRDSLSPRINGASPFEQALRDRRSNSTARSNPAVGSRGGGGDWTDKRIDTGKANARGAGGAGANRGAVASSAGGSLWMEAAAAVEKSGTAVAVAAPSGRVEGARNAPARPRSGSLSSPGRGAVATGSLHAGVATRRRPRKGSTSSLDDGGGGGSALSSPSSQPDAIDTRSSKFGQRQRNVGGGRETASAMAEAAEAAAAMSAARGHPDARRVEKRALAVQATADRALVRLEEQLGRFVTRRTSVHSPVWQSPRQSPASSASSAEKYGVRRFSGSPPTSMFSSPRESPRSPNLLSPMPPGRDRQQQHQQQWVAAATEGSARAPLAAAAALLMEQASSRRQELVSSVHRLHERAVALAVSETAPDARSPAGGVKSFRTGALVSGRDGVPSARPIAGFVARSGGDESDRVRLEGSTGESSVESNAFGTGTARSSTPPLAAESRRGWEGQRPSTAAAVAPIVGGMAGVSCCLDFERILGEGGKAELPGTMASLATSGIQEKSGASSSISREEMYGDRGMPHSDSSMVAERSFSGADQQSFGGVVGGPTLPSLREEKRWGERLPVMGGVIGSDFLAAEEQWPTIFRDVAVAEQHCREVLGIWEAAGGAFEDACEDF